jgi:hypothetical protein
MFPSSSLPPSVSKRVHCSDFYILGAIPQKSWVCPPKSYICCCLGVARCCELPRTPFSRSSHSGHSRKIAPRNSHASYKNGHLADALASNAAYNVNEAGRVTLPIGFAPGSHLYRPRCSLPFSAQRGLQFVRGLVEGPLCRTELILREE